MGNKRKITSLISVGAMEGSFFQNHGALCKKFQTPHSRWGRILKITKGQREDFLRWVKGKKGRFCLTFSGFEGKIMGRNCPKMGRTEEGPLLVGGGFELTAEGESEAIGTFFRERFLKSVLSRIRFRKVE